MEEKDDSEGQEEVLGRYMLLCGENDRLVKLVKSLKDKLGQSVVDFKELEKSFENVRIKFNEWLECEGMREAEEVDRRY